MMPHKVERVNIPILAGNITPTAHLAMAPAAHPAMVLTTLQNTTMTTNNNSNSHIPLLAITQSKPPLTVATTPAMVEVAMATTDIAAQATTPTDLVATTLMDPAATTPTDLPTHTLHCLTTTHITTAKPKHTMSQSTTSTPHHTAHLLTAHMAPATVEVR